MSFEESLERMEDEDISEDEDRALEITEIGDQIADLASDLDWLFDECAPSEFQEAVTILHKIEELAGIAIEKASEEE